MPPKCSDNYRNPESEREPALSAGLVSVLLAAGLALGACGGGSSGDAGISDTGTTQDASVAGAASAKYASMQGAALGHGAGLNGAIPFPADNAWNTDISAAPVDPNSANLIAGMGLSRSLHPDFGAGLYDGGRSAFRTASSAARSRRSRSTSPRPGTKTILDRIRSRPTRRSKARSPPSRDRAAIVTCW